MCNDEFKRGVIALSDSVAKPADELVVVLQTCTSGERLVCTKESAGAGLLKLLNDDPREMVYAMLADTF